MYCKLCVQTRVGELACTCAIFDYKQQNIFKCLKTTHRDINLFLLSFLIRLNRNTEIKTHVPAERLCRENSHREAAVAQLNDWLSVPHTETRTCAHTQTHTHTFTVDPLRHFTVYTPLCMHSLFFSHWQFPTQICFLLNSSFPEPQTTLKVNIVALIQL